MRGVRSAVLAAVVGLISACVHRPPPALRSAHLVVRKSGGPGLRPFVRAKVAGQPVMLLVDTGAVQSILPAAFARANELRSRSNATDELLLDANGKVTRMQLLIDVPVQFEGEASGGTINFLMNPSAQDGEAILAPQDLVRRGWALVIDLEREELAVEPEEIALKRVGADGSPLREVDFHRCLDEGLFNRSHRIVSTAINGVRADMLVDTGAESTVLTRNNPALRSMVSMTGQRGSTVGISSTGAGLLVEGVEVVFSTTSFVLPALVVPSSNTCAHGALGTDLLRHCTIVWAYSSLWVACRSAPEAR